MAITYPISLPTTPIASSIEWLSVNVAISSRSPQNSIVTVFDLPGEYWEARIALPPMTRDSAEAWVSALLSLNGIIGTFNLPAYGTTAPRGDWGGTVRIAGGGQTGKEITVDGLGASNSDAVKAGDFISIDGILYKVVTDAASSGGGVATIDIWPGVRVAHADNAIVTTSTPSGIFRLKEPFTWSVNSAIHFGLSFVATEDV